MKIYLLQSPAYKYNGLKGNYYSIAFVDEMGVVESIYGDHSMLFKENMNVLDIDGVAFSDEDRYIEVKEVTFDNDRFVNLMSEYTIERANIDVDNRLMQEKFYKDTSNIDIDAIIEYRKHNPAPRRTISCYFFMDCVI